MGDWSEAEAAIDKEAPGFPVSQEEVWTRLYLHRVVFVYA